MKKVIIVSTLLLICLASAFAQQSKQLHLTIPQENKIISNSLYNKISVLDSRINQNRYQFTINEQSFTKELALFLELSTDQSAHNGTLLLQIRDLSFYTNNLKGESNIRVTLYSVLNSQYYLIGTLDTEIRINAEKNTSEQLQNAVSKTILWFVSDKLAQPYIDNVPYSWEDINHIDHIERDATALYNNKQELVNGIYYSFKDIVTQTPNEAQMELKFKKDQLNEVKIKDQTDGKYKKVKPEQIYAVIADEQVYISFNKKYHLAYFNNGALYFDTEETSSNLGFSPSVSFGIGSGGYRGGGIGIGVFTRSKKDLITYKVDHINGKFIQIK